MDFLRWSQTKSGDFSETLAKTKRAFTCDAEIKTAKNTKTQKGKRGVASKNALKTALEKFL